MSVHTATYDATLRATRLTTWLAIDGAPDCATTEVTFDVTWLATFDELDRAIKEGLGE